MEEVMDIYGNIWTVIESVAFFVVVIIFFLDPIRRWNFFGYRPTAVLGVYDPSLKKVLMVEVQEAGGGQHVWSFIQGGIYDNNIQATTFDIIKRELGLDDIRFKLLNDQPLGTVRIQEAKIIKRSRISTVSIFPNLRGKGYLGCYVRGDLEKVKQDITLGEGALRYCLFDIEKACELVTSVVGQEHTPAKRQMIQRMLSEINRRI